MTVTINDIAKAANVSASTVSRVIANNPRIGTATRENVLRIMKEMNYHPNILARSLASKRTKIIGVILPSSTEKAFQHPFFPEILRGIGTVANKHNYNILLASVNNINDEKEVVKEFALGGITDGVILLTSRVKDPCISELMKMNFPFVVVGRPENDNSVNWVDNDNFSAGYGLTEYFIKKGHTNIAVVGVSQDFTVTMDRFEGYKKALKDNDIPFDENLVIEGKFIDNSTDNSTLSKLLSEERRPTGVIACDDFLAFGVISLINQLGLNVPKDVSVAGFNNVLLSNYLNPPLTSVDVNTFILGSKAFELLLASIESEHKSFNRAIIPTELIERESVCSK